MSGFSRTIAPNHAVRVVLVGRQHHKANMLSPEDPRWEELEGGYRVPFDPRPAIERLRARGDDAAAWKELWIELHHQGDLGDASYVALVLLMELQRTSEMDLKQLFWLTSTIEVERRRATNPPVPPWLESEYRRALEMLRELALNTMRQARGGDLTRGALAAFALTSGEIHLGALIWHLDDQTLFDHLDKCLSWSELYRDT